MELNFLPRGQGLATWRRRRTAAVAAGLALLVSLLGWRHHQWALTAQHRQAAAARTLQEEREAAEAQRVAAARRALAEQVEQERIARRQARVHQAREAAQRLDHWSAHMPLGLQWRQLEWEPGRLRLIGWAASEHAAHEGLRRWREAPGFPVGLDAWQVTPDADGRVRFELVLSSPAAASPVTASPVTASAAKVVVPPRRPGSAPARS